MSVIVIKRGKKIFLFFGASPFRERARLAQLESSNFFWLLIVRRREKKHCCLQQKRLCFILENNLTLIGDTCLPLIFLLGSKSLVSLSSKSQVIFFRLPKTTPWQSTKWHLTKKTVKGPGVSFKAFMVSVRITIRDISRASWTYFPSCHSQKII